MGEAMKCNAVSFHGIEMIIQNTKGMFQIIFSLENLSSPTPLIFLCDKISKIS